MRIELHIDRVVLNGVGDPRQARDIHEALHAELAKLVAAAPRATWQQSRRQRRLRAPEVRVGPAKTMGQSIARSVYQAVGHGH